jgi:hypothetical protein
MSNDRPLHMAAVNPGVGPETHLWLTSGGGDYQGRERLILLVGHWPTLGQPHAITVAPSPEGELVFDPTSWYLFVSSTQSNL